MPRFVSESGVPVTINPDAVIATQPATDPQGRPILGLTAVLLVMGAAMTVRGAHDAVDQALGLAETEEVSE